MEQVCCPLSSCDADETIQCHVTKKRTARKAHKCMECGEEISKGKKYEYASGIFDREPFMFKTCMSCYEIREHFSCGNGFIYGQLLEDLENYLFPDMKAGGPCFLGLSPEAKARLFEERLKWYEENNT